jgi:hypothetical protein
MDAYPAEFVAEALLEEYARRGVKWPTGRTKRLAHDGWRFADGFVPSGGFPLKSFLPLLTDVAFTADLRPRGCKRRTRRRHTHHLLRHAVRLMFERIIGRADFELRLDR